MTRFWPLILFIALSGFLYKGLFTNPQEIPSPLVGKPVPAFQLGALAQPHEIHSHADFTGRVTILNVFASWCESCRDEHPLLVELVKTRPCHVIGLDYKDTEPAALAWLRARGNPYSTVLFDGEGRVGIEFGVYGVPETFVIDKKGIIRRKFTGPITPMMIEDQLKPLLNQLEAEGA